MAGGQGRWAQKASAGESPFPGPPPGFRKMGRAHRATHRVAPTMAEGLYGVSRTIRPPIPWNQRCLMVSGRSALAPGPGSRGKAAFRWRPFIVRFERSLFLKPPALPEVYDSIPFQPDSRMSNPNLAFLFFPFIPHSAIGGKGVGVIRPVEFSGGVR